MAWLSAHVYVDDSADKHDLHLRRMSSCIFTLNINPPLAKKNKKLLNTSVYEKFKLDIVGGNLHNYNTQCTFNSNNSSIKLA